MTRMMSIVAKFSTGRAASRWTHIAKISGRAAKKICV
jgi:hypothetical protein